MANGAAVQTALDDHVANQRLGSGARSLADSDELPLEAEPKDERYRRLSRKKLYAAIRAGFGQGHLSHYQAWLQLRRGNSSPHSNQVVAWMPIIERVAHFFSRGEYHLALLLLWLGVRDLREQYPIWPIAHPHPLAGAIGAENLRLPFCPGLLSIAREAGIDHGSEFGTKQPYVATLDIVVTVPAGDRIALAVFSSKPINEPTDEIRWRTLERLELERRYCKAASAIYHISSSSLVPILMAGQLEWWLDCASLRLMPGLTRLVDPFAELINVRPALSVAEAVASAVAKLGTDLDTGWLLLRHCAWTQAIDIDPSKHILTSYPLRPGGRELRCSLQQRLFGATW